MSAVAFVAVRRAGPHHVTPGAWLRMDLLGSGKGKWAPRASLATVRDQAAAWVGNLNVPPMGVMELPSGAIVWEHQADVDDGPPEQLALC